ncbi:hypothetical protein ACFYST_30635 [Kitasatospora sp. NPDC004614]|uniref:hypothetical protein n=1 Tax=unclassified Kitasatospora TaxID=2633591 RepID=UPI003682A602
MISARAVKLAVAYPLFRAAADVADHWIQTDHQARIKGATDRNPVIDRDEDGRVIAVHGSAEGCRACAAHVATYVGFQGIALLVGSRLLGVRLRPGRVAAALAFSAVTHYVADRREPLRRFAEATGKGNFARLADHGMNGSYLLDQAFHHGCETVAALIASA